MNEHVEKAEYTGASCLTFASECMRLNTMDSKRIAEILRTAPGDPENIQDVYPLSPLQEDILFQPNKRLGVFSHWVLIEAHSPVRMRAFIASLQQIVARYDVLRSAVIREKISRPVQVVYRRAPVLVEELFSKPGCDPIEILLDEVVSRQGEWDIRRPPLVRLQVITNPTNDRCYGLLQVHHLACDYESFRRAVTEILGQFSATSPGRSRLAPYKDYVEIALSAARSKNAEPFFREELNDITETTALFGLSEQLNDVRQTREARQLLGRELELHIRNQAQRRLTSPATIFHAAWAMVAAYMSGRDDVVFGTALSSGLHDSADTQQALGVFTNVLPLRLQLDGITAQGIVECTQLKLAKLISVEQTVPSLPQRCSGIAGRAALFNSVLTYRTGAHRPHTEWPSAAGIRVRAHSTWTRYPIALSVDESATALSLALQTSGAVDPSRILEYMHVALQSLTDALDRRPQTLTNALPVLPAHEYRSIVHNPGAYPTTLPAVRLLDELFEEQVKRNPSAVAVVFEDESITYSELNAQADQLAKRLRKRGVYPEKLVAVFVERGLQMIIGILGVLKAGGAYLPIDPIFPTGRIRQFLQDAAPEAILTQRALIEQLPHTNAQLLFLDDNSIDISDSSDTEAGTGVPNRRADQLAYVIYTSGSTGKPKGVMVEHRNIAQLCTAAKQWLKFDQKDIWTLFHSISFDFSVWELWGALLHGGRLVVVPARTARDPLAFYRLLCEERVTVLNQTPSAFAQLADIQSQDPEQHALRVVLLGGERLEPHALGSWMRNNGAEISLLMNVYGITETTVFVTCHALKEHEIRSHETITIGKPLPNMHVYLLDRHGRPVPAGVAGEIYVGGAGVSRGYLNHPELTAQRFLCDPIGAPGARMYKSGDIARWREDGTLEYLGRNDAQVKIRGFRIELGEIEAQLVRHAAQTGVVVTAREDVPGEKRLVAYMTRNGARELSAEELRDKLRLVLPDYMVPSAFVTLDRLPLTTNGKLDYSALPPPSKEDFSSRPYEAPRGKTEEALAEMWRELLQVKIIGCNDNFFELGADSFSCAKLVSRVAQSLSTEISILDVFKHPTIRQMGRLLEGLSSESQSQPSDAGVI